MSTAGPREWPVVLAYAALAAGCALAVVFALIGARERSAAMPVMVGASAALAAGLSWRLLAARARSPLGFAGIGVAATLAGHALFVVAALSFSAYTVPPRDLNSVLAAPAVAAWVFLMSLAIMGWVTVPLGAIATMLFAAAWQGRLFAPPAAGAARSWPAALAYGAVAAACAGAIVAARFGNLAPDFLAPIAGSAGLAAATLWLLLGHRARRAWELAALGLAATLAGHALFVALVLGGAAVQGRAREASDLAALPQHFAGLLLVSVEMLGWASLPAGVAATRGFAAIRRRLGLRRGRSPRTP
ncbi:MAG: hypothetical protein IT557_18890 [Alphaproteobacteria bacterium]|nr:hypothetical protein [Alphaproteobacteria bacterium]